MNDDFPRAVPAAFPVVAFCCGLALARGVLHPALTAAAAMMIALLLLARRSTRPAAPAISFLAIGIAIGSVREARLEAEDRVLERVDPERFTSIVVPIERPWRRSGDASSLRARSFVLPERKIGRTITVTIWDEAPDPGRARDLVASGFLRCERDRCRLTVKSSSLTALEGEIAPWHPGAWNRAAYRRIARLGASSEEARRGAAQAAALALGRGEMLDPAVREAYRRGGTYHLLVFSGMQIAFAAGAIAIAFRHLGRPRLTDLILIAIALVAPPFAGHDPSVSRSALMIGIFAASRLLGRPTSVENLLFVSALVRLTLVPDELTEPGFVLTYAATGGLVIVGKRLAAGARTRLGRAVLYGLGAELGTAPVTAWFFHQVILASSVVTLLLSPLLSLMLGLSAAACALAFVSERIAILLLEAIGRFDRLAVVVNEGIADTIGTARFVLAPPAAVVAVGLVLGLSLAAANRKWTTALAVLSLVLPIAVSLGMERRRASVPDFQIEVLDVGQGEALLVREGRHAILIDGGGRRDDSSSFARTVLIPKLIDRGVRRLDAIVLTHADPDHCGALPDVIRSLRVGEVWISSRHLRYPCAGAAFETALARDIPVIAAERRTTAKAGPFKLAIFAARPPFRRSESNNTSIVLALSRQGHEILLTGDIERPAEFQLIEERPELARATILKVAHHGSRSSTSELFLAAARPQIALVSAGFRNSYGHPAPETLARLRAHGVRVYRTDLSGTIRLVFRNGRIHITGEIDTPRRADTL